MSKSPSRPLLYEVKVYKKRTSVWDPEKYEQLSMTLTKHELDVFCRDTFAHHPDVTSISFKHGRQSKFISRTGPLIAWNWRRP